MEAKSSITSSDIQTEIINRQERLEAQIDHLDKFITDLTAHKISLENANRQIEKLAQTETDANKRGKYYTVLRINIELLTKIFNSISELESIKHRYHKEIDDVILGKIKIIAVDIRKIEEGVKNGDGDLSTFFEKLGNAMSNVSKVTDTSKSNLDDNPEYKL